MFGAIFLTYQNVAVQGKQQNWRNGNHLQTVYSDEIFAASQLDQK